jgi:hypothetical protein
MTHDHHSSARTTEELKTSSPNLSLLVLQQIGSQTIFYNLTFMVFGSDAIEVLVWCTRLLRNVVVVPCQAKFFEFLNH